MRFFKREKDAALDAQIDSVLYEMNTMNPDDEKYENLLGMYERLHALKAKKNQRSVSNDTIAIVLGNIVITIIVVAYERTHVMTSKGMNQITKPNQPKY